MAVEEEPLSHAMRVERLLARIAESVERMEKAMEPKPSKSSKAGTVVGGGTGGKAKQEAAQDVAKVRTGTPGVKR